MRAGLASALLSKEELIARADNMISKDEQPGIFSSRPDAISKRTNNQLFQLASYTIRQTGVEFLTCTKPWDVTGNLK